LTDSIAVKAHHKGIYGVFIKILEVNQQVEGKKKKLKKVEKKLDITL